MKSAKKNDARYSYVSSIQSIAKMDMKNIALGFGLRFQPILKISCMHTGLNFFTKQGRVLVYAITDGVVKVPVSDGDSAKVVCINHQNGYMTSHTHLQAYKVEMGQKIKQGEVIDYIWNTDLSTGLHLHYEVVKKGEKIDILGYFYDNLNLDGYKKMVAIAEKMTRSLD
ncbi:MAG: M23 family metallopeptidase [Flavobacteriales bacterium AspAUS03]